MTRPYRPDGGAEAKSVLLLLILGIAGGAMSGLIAGYVSQWIYLVFLFPCLIGAVVGGVLHVGVKRANIRSPFVAGIAGLLGGVAAMLAMHYLHYQRFMEDQPDPEVRENLKAIAALPEDVLRQQNLPPEVITNLKDPNFVREMDVDSFPEFMDYRAHVGVTFSKVGGGAGNDQGTNLGYTGSWIYWGLEVLLVAGIAFAISRTAATEPFCAQCNSWKGSQIIGGLAPGDDAVSVFENGDLGALAEYEPGPVVRGYMVSMAACPHCQADAEIDVKLTKVAYDKKGQAKGFSESAYVTYPGEALPVFATMFQPPVVPQEVPPEEETPPTSPEE